MVKIYTFLSLCILSSAIGLSGTNKKVRDTVAVTITLNNLSNNNNPIDSVFVVIDRYDLTGAGIVKSIFYPVNNKIAITIPKGKYFVDVFCLGMHKKEHFGSIIIAKSNKKNRLLFKMHESGTYTPGTAQIPQETIDPSRLSITSYVPNR